MTYGVRVDEIRLDDAARWAGLEISTNFTSFLSLFHNTTTWTYKKVQHQTFTGEDAHFVVKLEHHVTIAPEEAPSELRPIFEPWETTALLCTLVLDPMSDLDTANQIAGHLTERLA